MRQRWLSKGGERDMIAVDLGEERVRERDKRESWERQEREPREREGGREQEMQRYVLNVVLVIFIISAPYFE